MIARNCSVIIGAFIITTFVNIIVIFSLPNNIPFLSAQTIYVSIFVITNMFAVALLNKLLQRNGTDGKIQDSAWEKKWGQRGLGAQNKNNRLPPVDQMGEITNYIPSPGVKKEKEGGKEK